MVSACLITYNEQEMLPYSLAFLTSIPEIKEICVMDSVSTDKTLDILKIFQKKYPHIKYNSKAFVSFGAHKNMAMEMVTQPYTLLIDADETYSPNLSEMFRTLPSHINFIRIPTLLSIGDMKHYIDRGTADPHIRVIKTGMAKFVGEVHEDLCSSNYNGIHSAQGPDILNANHVFMKHHLFLKSDLCLKEKGEHWDEMGALKKSTERGIPMGKDSWVIMKNNKDWKVRDIPEHLWDRTTNLWGTLCLNQIQQFVDQL
jgi:glycosyltransferase involved in cell wall biosynthesis